jgi:FlaA1/EpsC-like NDP-sugar epimerase
VNRLLNYRKLVILASQIVLLAMSYYGSFLLRFDFHPDETYQPIFMQTLPLVVAVELLAFWAFGLLRGWWRYAGMNDALDIFEASFAGTVFLYLLIELVFKIDGYPRSVLAINLILTMLFVGGSRFAVRAYTESAQRGAAELNTLIVGAGRAGSTIARELKRTPVNAVFGFKA